MQLILIDKLAAVLGDHRYSSRLKTLLGETILVDPMMCVPEPQVIGKLKPR